MAEYYSEVYQRLWRKPTTGLGTISFNTKLNIKNITFSDFKNIFSDVWNFKTYVKLSQ